MTSPFVLSVGDRRAAVRSSIRSCVSVLSLKEFSMKKLLVLAMALLCGLGVLSSSALAADSSFVRVGAFAEQGPDGAVSHQRHIAVLWATGDTYVADVTNSQVTVYRPDGTGATLLTSFGSGVLSDPNGMAIDQDTGSVYVSDASGVRKFDSDGAPTPAFTTDPAFGPVTATGALSFDQTANQLLVADTAGGVVRRFSASGAVVSSFNGSAGAGSPGAFTGLRDIATDSTGDILIIDAVGDPYDGGASRLERYSSAGVWEATVGPLDYPPVVVGVVPVSDEVIVGAVAPPHSAPTLHRFTSAGEARADLTVDSSLQYASLVGVGADDGSEGRLSVATDVGGGSFSWGGLVSVQVYAQKLLATVATTPVSPVAPFTATVNGTVNPEGAETGFHFEIAQGDSTTWKTIDSDGDGDESAGSGTAAVAVSDIVDGLHENTSYRVRVVALRDGETSTSAATTFTTSDAADPTVTIAAATEAADDRAKLSGVVNPHGGPGVTLFHFEYSGDGGNSWMETSDGLIGDGNADVAVSRTISGLDRGRVYKARLVATKETTLVVRSSAVDFVADSGDSCPNAAVRAQQQARRLPFCGAYEMVSPVDKAGGFTDYTPQTQLGFVGLSVDGSAAIFSSYRAFADSKSGMPATYYSKRTPTGWAVNTASPPPAARNPRMPSDGVVWIDASDDLSAGISSTADDQDPANTNESSDTYRLTNDGQITLVSRGNGAERTTTPDVGAVQLSRDGRDAYFKTSSHLVPEDAARTAGTDVYVRTGDHTRLLNRDNNGVPLSRCGSDLGSQSAFSVRHAVSRDGSRAFFTVPSYGLGDLDCDKPAQVYVRLGDGDGEVVPVSASQRSVPDTDGPRGATFEGAAADGSRVMFSSAERLTDDAPPNGGVYSFDVATRELRLLVGPANSVSVVKVADSAKTMYFFTDDTAISGVTGRGLYAYRDGESQVDLVALDDPTSTIQGDMGAQMERERPIVTNGDDQVAFVTSARLTGFDNRGFKEVYLYDRQDGLVCVSCDPAKQRPADGGVSGDAGLPRQFAYTERPSFSKDGKLLFDSTDRLVKDDVNARNDVYLYADGRVSLISGGRGDAGAYPHGISNDGKTVLFSSSDGLVPQDRDGNQDVYAVRADGGFLAPSSVQVAQCSGDSCQAPPSDKLAGMTPGSQAAGGGDPTPVRRAAKLTLKRLTMPTPAARRAAVRSGMVKVQLTLAGTGVAGVRIDGRVGAKARRVASASRSVRAGSGQRVTFSLRLSAAARRELARHHRLVLTIRPVIDDRAKAARSLTLASAASRRSGR